MSSRASWCKPCREELVAVRELERKWAGKNIAFMYVSFDTAIAGRKKASVYEKLATHPNYLLSKTKNSSCVKEFNIRTIPRYMLIGKDGTIINDNAPTPSDPKLQRPIDSNLP
ncbi:MAG: TlpA family protein disulfide reductase [Williamsia sp.]|nr:TlpA family protein disulfide reductase [Williamsia sp.]